VQIIRGEIRAGESLPQEAELMDRFGVSRPTLREAVRVLEAERLIVIRRGAQGGARVQVPDADVAARYAGLVLQYRGATLKDVYQARLHLESGVAALVAKRRTKADVKALRVNIAQEWEALRAAHDPSAAGVQADFHRLMVELTRNQTLVVMSGMVHEIIATANRTMVSRHPDSRQHWHMSDLATKGHEHITDLIEAKDIEAADRVWREHLEQTAQFVLRDLGDQTPLDLLE
jgi:DNA-binding FadR family transcriptional regulator